MDPQRRSRAVRTPPEGTHPEAKDFRPPPEAARVKERLVPECLRVQACPHLDLRPPASRPRENELQVLQVLEVEIGTATPGKAGPRWLPQVPSSRRALALSRGILGTPGWDPSRGRPGNLVSPHPGDLVLGILGPACILLLCPRATPLGHEEQDP